MKYNFTGIPKAAQPNSSAAFNFSGIPRAEEEQPSTAQIFGIGDTTKKVEPPKQKFDLSDEMDRASNILRNIGRRMVSPVRRMGEGYSPTGIVLSLFDSPKIIALSFFIKIVRKSSTLNISVPLCEINNLKLSPIPYL